MNVARAGVYQQNSLFAGKLSEWVNRTAFLGLVAAIFTAPLPLGSNRPWAMSLLAILVAGSLLLALGSFIGDHPWPRGMKRARWPLAMAALFSTLVAGQLLLTALHSAGLHAEPATLSIAHTQLYLMRSLTCLAAMVLVLLTVTSRSRCIVLMGCVLGTGLIQAGLGILLSRSGSGYEYLFLSFEPYARVSGTFANPNHFAGYMAMALGAGIGLLIAQYEEGRYNAQGWRMRLLALLQFALSLKMILRLALVILVIGLVLSHSRMGNVAFFFALIATGLVLAVRSRVMRKTALTLVVTMVLVDLFIIGQWIGFDRIADRFRETSVLAHSGASASGPAGRSMGDGVPTPREESVEERLQVPRLAAALALNKPWFGHGGGTFHLAFPPVKPDWVFSGHWNYAHNDFAEVAVDVGFVGLTLWMGIGVFSAVRGVRLISDRQPRLNRGVGTMTLIAIIASGLQSVMDFGLQIPANALNFSVLLTISWLVGGLPLDIRRAASITRSTR